MLTKVLKASVKTNINRKYETYISLNKEINIEEYINNNKRKLKEIEIINYLKDKESENPHFIKANYIKKIEVEK